MKLFTRMLLLVVPMLAGCKGELAGVTINLAADGSGDCDIFGIRDIQLVTGDSADPNRVLQNAKEVRSMDIRLRQASAKFASINDLKIGDLGFALEKQGAKNLLTVRIPAGSASQWFGAFGVSEESLRVFERAAEEERKEAAERRKNDPKASGPEVEIPKPSTAAFTVNLPGELEGQDFETVPVGIESKITIDKKPRGATLAIPLADIQANKMKEIVWKIRYATP